MFKENIIFFIFKPEDKCELVIEHVLDMALFERNVNNNKNNMESE